MSTILVIDDDERLQEAIKDYFLPYGFTTYPLLNACNLSEDLVTVSPSLVLLDVMLPKGPDGFLALSLMRKVSSVPIIMLTAKGEEIDRVLGLEMGADDYLTKPFSLRELLARVKAQLRRNLIESADYQDILSSSSLKPLFVKTDGFTLEPARHRLLYGEKYVLLSGSETNILKVLMEHPQMVIERSKLARLALGDNHNIADRGVDVHVSHLRGQIKKLNPNLSPIQTIRGEGYLWTITP
jgi:DNA-binding response OmpR family regulator